MSRWTTLSFSPALPAPKEKIVAGLAVDIRAVPGDLIERVLAVGELVNEGQREPHLELPRRLTPGGQGAAPQQQRRQQGPRADPGAQPCHGRAQRGCEEQSHIGAPVAVHVLPPMMQIS
jgi:hypothetical protein